MKLSQFMPNEGEEYGPSKGTQAPPQGSNDPHQQQGGPDLNPPEGPEKEAMDQLVLAAINILNQKEAEILKMLKGKNVAKALSQAAEMVLQMLVEQSGQQPPLKVLLYGGITIMQEIMVSAQSKGLDISEDLFGKASQYYIFKLLQKHNISPQQLEGMFADVPQEEMQSMLEKQAQYSMA